MTCLINTLSIIIVESVRFFVDCVNFFCCEDAYYTNTYKKEEIISPKSPIHIIIRSPKTSKQETTKKEDLDEDYELV